MALLELEARSMPLPGTQSEPLVIGSTRLAALGDLVAWRADERPHKAALVDPSGSVSYGALHRRASQVANGLQAQGIGKGERVAYLGKNRTEFFELLMGAARAGAILTPIGWRLAPDEISHILNHSGARLIAVEPAFQVGLRQALEQVSHPLRVLSLTNEVGESSTFAAWRDAQSDHAPAIAVLPSDMALQLYTSGTTGRPKGVMLTHDNLLGARQKVIDAALDWQHWRPDDVSLTVMPLNHIGGIGWTLLGLLNGVTNVIAPEFDPVSTLDLIKAHRVSVLLLVPSALKMIADTASQRAMDISSLRQIVYGAAPMPPELLRRCIEVFGCGFVQLYGMTETSGALSYLPQEDHAPAGNPRMRSAGVPLPGVEVRIIDARGQASGIGEVGEIVTRSRFNMAGYCNDTAATSATISEEGWLRTGDAGSQDGDGYLYIQDRIKDVIVSGGENIYPAEVENAIGGHPAVAEVAVIGVPDETWGEAVKALVICKPDHTVEAKDIIAFTKSRIAGFKAPKSVEFVSRLPRTASGKVLRRELREPYWAGRQRRVN
jgi:long-chain acyl-CoA synthetase